MLASTLLGGCSHDSVKYYALNEMSIRKYYILNDTLVFTNEDSCERFVITQFERDSFRGNTTGFIGKPKEYDAFYVRYREIPSDKFRNKWIEFGPNN